MPAAPLPARAPYRESVAGVLVRTSAPVVLAALATGLPVFFHLAGQMAGVAACAALATILATFAAPAAPVALVFAYLFQNLFVAFVSPHIGSIEQLNAIRAYNFLLTAAVWAILYGGYWLQRAGTDRHLRRAMDATTGALVLIGLYFAVGLASNPGNAVVYLRNIAAPFLLFQICALVGYRHRASIFGPLALIALVALLYGYAEMLGGDRLFRLVGGDVYINWRIRQDYEAGVWLRDLQETGRVMRGYLDSLVIDFLNTPLLADWGLRWHRLLGPNFHSISFAYALAGLAVVLCAAGHGWYAVLVLPLILAIGSKGALVLLVFVALSLVLVTHFAAARRLWLFAALLGAYAAVGIVAGIRTQDYHVIGFIGGLRGFVANPIGHGIGAGGNLSLNVSGIDWSRFQNLGHTDVAVESAIGVLLYQMGVAGILVIGVLAWIAVRLWRSYRQTGQRPQAAVALAILTLIVNGIFQEEALFAPLAMGIMAAFAGLLLGRAYGADRLRAAGRR